MQNINCQNLTVLVENSCEVHQLNDTSDSAFESAVGDGGGDEE